MVQEEAIYNNVWKVDNETWPSLKDTEITRGDVLLRYERCKAKSIQMDARCAQLHGKLHEVWKSTSTMLNSKKEDFERLTLASKCCVFYYEELMKPDPGLQMFSWERDYLSSPPLVDMKNIACANNSKIFLLSPSANSFTITIGSEVRFKVDLYTGTNERKNQGGDKVEVWLINEKLHAAITAEVTDNTDGTYTAVTLLPWSGEVKVMATIAHHRELLRTVLFLQRVFKSLHFFTGNYISTTAAEATLCSPFPYLPNHLPEEICNITKVNGFPWYCGKPVKKHLLNCSHFMSEAKIFYPSYMPMTQAEEDLLTMTERQRPFLIPSNLLLDVKPGSSLEQVLPKPSLLCKERNLSLTFEDNCSYGFFYQGSWRPLACQLPEISKEFLLGCLKDVQAIFIGDSNARKQMELLTSKVPCVDKIRRGSVNWHAPLRCDNEKNNMSIQYYPHNFPFYGSQREEVKSEVLYSEARLLDSIPSYGKYLIHIHTFLHLIPFHLSLVEHRLRVTREAIRKLLDRNPHVIIAYQSAHSAYDRRPGNYHKLGAFLLELQRSVLNGLGNRVMFVYTWPMTVAVANNNEHPPIANHFSNYFLGYVCGRL